MASARLAPLHDPAVIWSPQALDQIRRWAVDGLMALPHRGMEVGGLLLGTASDREPYQFTIEAIAPIPCEHQYGPSFVLSENDRRSLVALFTEVHECQEHTVIGYFRSRTSREAGAELDGFDRELITEYFSDPHHIFLALRPWSVRRCEAALYVWSGESLMPVGEKFDVCERTMPPASIPPPPPAKRPAVPAPPLPLVPDHRREQFWKIATISLAMLAGLLLLPKAGREPVVNAAEPQPVRQAAPREIAAPAPAEDPTVIGPREAEPIVQRAVSLELLHPAIPESIASRIISPVTVTVRVGVDESGRVISVKPAEYSEGLQRFVAQQAAEAARTIRFRPARAASGRAVPSTEDLSYTFEPR